jgi:hypothetical protein
LRKAVLGIVVSLAAAGCASVDAATRAPRPAGIEVTSTEAPYVLITAGPVSGLVPEGWSAVAAERADPRLGFVASPRASGWHSIDGGSAGVAATWVDAAEVGVPTDVYYLAASGPLLSSLVSSPGCRAEREVVVVNNVPSFVDGVPTSPGDYVVRAEGVCAQPDGTSMRWSYFIAAPGYGPAKWVGIPGSGLYVAVAVTRDTPRADERLSQLLGSVRFGDAKIRDLMRAARTEPV